MIWITSDTHFGHPMVANLRGFETPEEMFHRIASNWRKTVSDEDEVIIAGDLVMGGWRKNLPLFKELPGRKHVVAGNHDRVHPSMSNAHKYHAEFMKLGGFESISLMMKLSVNGQRVTVSHFPYWGDHVGEERYEAYRPRWSHAPILHGHTHSSEKFTRPESFEDPSGPPQIHIGVDAWNFKPVPLTEAVNLIEEW